MTPLDLCAHIEAQIGRDLLVAAAAGVQLAAPASRRAPPASARQNDECLRRRMVAHHRFARFGCSPPPIASSAAAESPLFSLAVRMPAAHRADACALLAAISCWRSRQSNTIDRCHCFKFRIERLAKAAGPHLPGLLFVRHCLRRTSQFLPFSFCRCSAAASRCLCSA